MARLRLAVVGSVACGHDGHRGWLYYLAVAPECQRNGLGRALVNAAEAWLGAKGIRKAMLMVRDSNDRALGFYDRVGYARSPVVVLERWLAGHAP